MAKKKPNKKLKHLTIKEIKELKSRRSQGEKVKALSKKFNVSESTVRNYTKNVQNKKSQKSDKFKVEFKYIDITHIRNPLILEQYVKWFAVPSYNRTPRFQQGFAKEYGVSEDTLSDWKRLDGFWDEVKLYSYQNVREETVDVLHGLALKGKLGDGSAGKVFLQAVENFSEKSVVDHKGSALSDERMAEIAGAVRAWYAFLPHELRQKNETNDERNDNKKPE